MKPKDAKFTVVEMKATERKPNGNLLVCYSYADGLEVWSEVTPKAIAGFSESVERLKI